MERQRKKWYDTVEFSVCSAVRAYFTVRGNKPLSHAMLVYQVQDTCRSQDKFTDVELAEVPRVINRMLGKGLLETNREGDCRMAEQYWQALLLEYKFCSLVCPGMEEITTYREGEEED